MLEHLSHRRLSLTGYSMDGLDDGTNTQVQLMDGLQVPLDDSYGQPSLLPQGHHQAYQIDPQALLAQNHPLQGLFGQPAPLAYRTDAGYPCSVTSTGTGSSIFPSSLYPSAVQVSPAVGTDRHGMLHPRVGVMRWRAKPWRRGFLGSFFSGACRLECG